MNASQVKAMMNEEGEAIGPNRWDIYYLAGDHACALEAQSKRYIKKMLLQGYKLGHNPSDERWEYDIDDIETNEYAMEAADIKARLAALNYD